MAHQAAAVAEGAGRLAAVIENQAREIGLAVLDLTAAPRLVLVQLVEQSRHYSTTLSQLQAYSPAVVVVCSSTQSASMLGASTHVGQAYELANMPRGSFDDTKAIVRLEAVADAISTELLSSSIVKHSLYLALGAAGVHGITDSPAQGPLHASLLALLQAPYCITQRSSVR